MTNDQLFEMIGNTSDALLQKAEFPAKPTRQKWLRYAGLAACLTLCASGAAWYISTLNPVYTPDYSSVGSDDSTPPDNEHACGLPIIEGNFAVGGMGFEGMEFYDISELKSGNPWHPDAGLTTLPVFENVNVYQESGNGVPVDEERMMERLRETAALVGVNIDGLEIEKYYSNYGNLTLEDLRDKFPSEEEAIAYMESGRLTKYRVSADGYRFDSDAWFSTRIEFTPSIRLPEGMDFGHHDSYEQYCTSAEYLLETYLDAFGMEQPTISIEGGDYNIYGEQSYHIYFYDAAGDLTEQILSYNFDSVKFACDDVRQLRLIDQKQTDRTHKLGDYPILTPEEAEEMFLAGDYLTTVPEEYSTEDMTVAKMELIYRTGTSEKYYMPYYRIYAEVTPDFERDIDTRTYGAFYIPAVRPEYLADVETWDGSFN